MSSLLDALRRLGQPKQAQALSPEAITQIQNARYGVLANNPGKQQQLIQSGQVQHPNAMQQLLPQLGAAVPKVAAATGLAAARLGTGTAQGVSGLVDLATPGTGTSRVTDGLNHAAAGIDHTAQNNGINPAYRVMQAALTPASFYAPGTLLKAISDVPAASKVVPTLDNGRAVSRIANQALQGATPLNAVNAASGIATDLGRQAGQGQQITPMQAGLTTAANVLTPLALPAAGQATLEAGKAAPAMLRQGAQGIDSLSSKAINTKAAVLGLRSQLRQLDAVTAAHQKQLNALPIDNYQAAEILQRKIDRNDALKRQLLSKSIR